MYRLTGRHFSGKGERFRPSTVLFSITVRDVQEEAMDRYGRRLRTSELRGIAVHSGVILDAYGEPMPYLSYLMNMAEEAGEITGHHETIRESAIKSFLK